MRRLGSRGANPHRATPGAPAPATPVAPLAGGSRDRDALYMTLLETPPQPTRQGPRVALVVTGALAAILAVCLLAAGAAALWGEGQKDDDGYLSTGSHRFATATQAMATESLDIDLDGKDWLVGVEDLGDARLTVASETGEPVFAGVARTSDVTSYLRGVDHALVTDIESSPFRASYRDQAGERAPAPPAGERFWAASTQGTGSQTLDWQATDGNWSVVVMNADGSRGVTADVSAGAKVGFLDELGWSALGGGALLLAAAAGLLTVGLRRRPRAA